MITHPATYRSLGKVLLSLLRRYVFCVYLGDLSSGRALLDMLKELVERCLVSLSFADDLHIVSGCLSRVNGVLTVPSEAFSTRPVSPRVVACLTVKLLVGH